jgi:ATP-dependent Clp protease ATP-binding subunit ClpC
MFERYTENARRVLFFARYESSELGDLQIRTEHLLLGLGRATTGTAARILRERGISLEDIRREIARHVAVREKVSTSVEIPFSSETKRILQFAAEEADGLRHSHIGTEHLLLGILREEESRAATILMTRGLRAGELREALAKLVRNDGPSSHRTEVSALIHGINQLLERLAAITAESGEARSLVDEIRQRVSALERQMNE